jgi:ATP phosphoribosyltransferase
MSTDAVVRLGLPKGRMQEGLFRLLADAGLPVRTNARGYRPTLPMAGFDAKILKPQAIVEMLHLGSRDLGFAGADWVREKGAELVEVLDTGLDPVRIVAAAPRELLVEGRLPAAPPEGAWRVASEYEALTRAWIAEQALRGTFVRSWGATEVLPPEDADVIVDNTATGSTLRENGLDVLGTLMTSSTRLYAHPRALDVAAKRALVDDLVLLLRSVLEARRRVMVEVNCGPADLEAIIRVLPCMREPTVSSLHAGSGYAVKSAVPRADLPTLIPKLKANGGTDVVVTELAQIVP